MIQILFKSKHHNELVAINEHVRIIFESICWPFGVMGGGGVDQVIFEVCFELLVIL